MLKNHSNSFTKNCPTDVGILAIEIYFPKTYVNQDALEDHDNVSKGKYTIGLGQSEMSFCCDNEDINSLCLTAVANLIEKYKINYSDIGRLEVGTETIIDKSKSVKTVLMTLFEKSGNFDVEGVDTSNACYGGTSALFNAVAWVESSSWDGRYAVVVCGDIAVYANGPARCTGGAGAIAMLVGPNAPLVLESALRGSYMRHAYDFYKPDLASEYPIVDGKLSVKSYIEALDYCYFVYCRKASKKLGLVDQSFCLGNIDFMIFHCPYAKLVQKSVARLVLNDAAHSKLSFYCTNFNGLIDAQKYKGINLADSIFDRTVEKDLVNCSKTLFEEKTLPSLFVAKRIGNMYTPSLYSCLISLLIQLPPSSLISKRIGMFSYGSGLASSMFSLHVSNPKNSYCNRINSHDKFSLSSITSNLQDVYERLNNRICFDPAKFSAVLKQQEETHLYSDYKPKTSHEFLFPGTFYLKEIDKQFRRSYDRKT